MPLDPYFTSAAPAYEPLLPQIRRQIPPEWLAETPEEQEKRLKGLAWRKSCRGHLSEAEMSFLTYKTRSEEIAERARIRTNATRWLKAHPVTVYRGHSTI